MPFLDEISAFPWCCSRGGVRGCGFLLAKPGLCLDNVIAEQASRKKMAETASSGARLAQGFPWKSRNGSGTSPTPEPKLSKRTAISVK